MNDAMWRTVVAPSLGVLVSYFGAVTAAYAMVPWMSSSDHLLRVVSAFSLVQLLASSTLLLLLLAKKFHGRSVLRRAMRWEPEIRGCLSQQSAGDDRTAALEKLKSHDARSVESCLIEMLGSTKGEGKRRLTVAAEALGYAPRWRRLAARGSVWRRRYATSALVTLGAASSMASLEKALSDTDALVRLIASRGLAGTGAPAAARVFLFALTQPLLIRALLAEDLKRHAETLCRDILPSIAGSEQRLAALGMVSVWRKSVHIPGLEEMLVSADPEIAGSAVRLLPYSGEPWQQEQGVLTALGHPEASVRAAAAAVAGQMEVAAALSMLAAGIGDPNAEAARACALALGKLGAAAWPVLQTEILLGSPRAAIAMEALEMAHTGRVEVRGR